MKRSDTESADYVARLEWALVNIMSGMTVQDIRGETGLPDDACDRLDSVRHEAVRGLWAKQGKIQEIGRE